MADVPGSQYSILPWKQVMSKKYRASKSPVFQSKVDKGVILEGLDRNLIKQEKEAFRWPRSKW